MRTGTSSSELLLEAKCRALLRDELLEQEQRRQKLIELGYKAAKKKKPRRTCKQRLTFYATSSLALVAISGGCALLFLVPLYVDPAFSTLTADFFPEPVICTTSKREDLWGLFNCTWSSCREGCTSEVYRCTHIYVTYTPWSNASSNSTTNIVTSAVGMTEEIEEAEEIIDAVLLVNIKGCGYPPIVDCENFTREMGYEGSQFPCYYSRVNRSIVMADYDREAELTIIIHYFAAPLVMTLATTAVLCVMHCDCRCQPPPRRRSYPRRNIARSRNNEISEHSISTRVERRGRPIRCECGEVAKPPRPTPRQDEDTSKDIIGDGHSDWPTSTSRTPKGLISQLKEIVLQN